MAQGAVATGAIAARGAATSVTRGVPTAARIANGATVEREVAYRLDKTSALRLGLRNPDLTTARRIAAAINRRSAARSPRPPIRAPWRSTSPAATRSRRSPRSRTCASSPTIAPSW